MKNNKDNDDDKRRKIIIMIIIIIIIILLLLTSCTSKFWGRIGYPYMNEGEVEIKDGTNDKEIILNKYLKFDAKKFEFFLNEEDGKLTYYYKYIHPKKFTCRTSNSKIATCVVKNGYVLLKTKKTGKVDVILDTETNGKIYRAKAKVTIKGRRSYIRLSSTSGTIYLKCNKTLYVSYQLVGLSGNVTAKVSDPSVASIYVEDGRIKIVGKKKGRVKVEVSITDKSGTHTSTYYVTVSDTPSKKSSSSSNRGASSTQSEASKPSSSTVKKDGDSSLKKLTSSKGGLTVKSGVYDYYLSVENETDHLTLKAVPNSKKATMTYKVNGKTYASLNDIPLKVGKNEIEITVVAEDGSKSTYTITVERSKKTPVKDNALESLTVSEGKLQPNFDKDILDYHVTVDSTVEHVDITPKAKDKNAKVTYKVDGKEVEDLKDLELKTGSNKVEITVTDEDGKSRTYTVTIEKEKSKNNYLKELQVEGGSFKENFDKNKNQYNLEIPFDQDSITMTEQVEDSKSKVTYKVDGKEVDNLKDLEFDAGDHTIEITVTSESGEENTYEVSVHKKKRTIEMDNKEYNIYQSYDIPYTVYEDGKPLKPGEYNLNDVTVTWNPDFQGTVEVHEGYITVIPDHTMNDQTLTLTVHYCEDYATSSAQVSFKFSNYYVNTYSDTFDMNMTEEESKRDIVFQNNLFSNPDKVKWKALEDGSGIRIYEEGNDDVYLDLYFDKDELKIQDVMGSNSLDVVVEALKNGKLSLQAKAYAYGEEVSDLTLTLNVSKKYVLTLDAADGYFDLLTTIYEFELGEEDMPFDLTSYIQGYREDENCLHYPLIGFSTVKGATEVEYDQTITIDQDTILYAVYAKESSDQPIEEEYNVYLTEVDIFHNEEYFKLYNRDKIIYPGAFGSYRIEFSNNSSRDIEITSVTLEEETICMNDTDCLNMGYILKDYQDQYYFGNKNEQYEILNTHSKTEKTENLTKNVISVPISIKKGEKTELSLLWKWISQNDKVDTWIGNRASEVDTDYKLTVSIQYKATKTACENGG